MSTLLPEGVSLAECPYPLHNAILTALRILSYDEFPSDERPPKRIWLDGEKLSSHWKRVEQERAKKYGLPPPESDEPVDDDTPSDRNTVELITRG